MNLLIIDGNSIANRAFYGIRSLNAPDGTPTNAIYGFLSIINPLYEKLKPDGVCVAFDRKAPTFRHLKFCSYKAQRKPMPEELCVQMPILKEVLTQMGIPMYELDGYEADDILGTVSRRCEEEGWNCFVLTGDRDSLQLVSSATTVHLMKTAAGQTTTTAYTPEIFRSEYGFEPKALVDLKALMGDSSDNITGVPGIGEKTAKDLIQRFGSISNLYASLDSADLKPTVKTKLATGRQSAEDSHWLATILREVPMTFVPAENLWNRDYLPGLHPLFERLGFRKLIVSMNVQSIPAAQPVGTEECVPAQSPELSSSLCCVIVDGAQMEPAFSAISAAPALGLCLTEDPLTYEFSDGVSRWLFGQSLPEQDRREMLQRILMTGIPVVTCGLKDLLRTLERLGIPTGNFTFDPSLAAYVLHSTAGQFDLPALCQAYLSGTAPDSGAVLRLADVLGNKLKQEGADRLYREIEFPLCSVLASMESRGMLVDREALVAFGTSLKSDIETLEQQIYFYAGERFNINSPKQLGTILFDVLKIPHGKKTKTGWSTGADILEPLRYDYPIVDAVLEYRMLTKLKSTYTDGLLKVIEPDGRIRTSFQMTVTATGRLSSTEPNLQNIPVRRELGAQIRRMFIPSPGNVLVDADYSQIELRILAEISGDEAMRRAFRSGEDFHTVTASYVFNVPVDQVTPSMRSSAKAVNFGIIYGMGAFSLSRDIGVSVAEARRYIDSYLGRFSRLRQYLTDVVKEGKQNGYVKTMYGRRRYLPELADKNHKVRAFGERVALNMPIQGTAADIIKLAMIRGNEALKNAGLRARLILQVHDELLVECPESEQEKAAAILKECMESVTDFSVPLIAEVKVGNNWSEAH